MESRFGVPFNENDPSVVSMIETAVYKNAQECLSMMSERLGDQPYLFGKAPSSVDALLYGYLAPLLKAPFPNPKLKNHLQACPNLVKFVSRITMTYFSKTAMEYEKSQKAKQEESTNNETKTDDDEETINKTKLAIAGTVAASAMTAYAFHSGFIDIVRSIEIQIVDADDEDDEGQEHEDDSYYSQYNERED